MIPFEMLVPKMGTGQVWEYTHSDRRGNQWGQFSDLEEQLDLQSDSLRKLLNRIRTVEKAEADQRQLELEEELEALQV